MRDLAAIAIVLIVILYVFPMLVHIDIKPSTPAVIETSAPTSDMVKVNKPLKISVIDQWAGSAVSSATISIYDGNTLLETLTTDSNGQAITALPYMSGKVYNVKVSKDNAFQWFKLTIPYMTRADAEASAYNPVSIKFWSLGSYSIKLMLDDGTVVTDGGTINLTTLGRNVVTVTVMVINTLDNSGYVSSVDPIYNEGRYAYLVAYQSDATKLVLTGLSGAKEVGNAKYYWSKVPDDMLVKYKVGQEYVKPGTYTVSVQIDGSALGSGESVTLSFTLKLYGDEAAFMNKGIWSSDGSATDAATISVTVAK